MFPNSAAENVLGTIGTVCWTGQLIPQIWKSWKDHSTEGLSAYLLFIWALSSIPLGVYAVVHNINIPLIVQPQLFGVLSAFSWTQCLYYSHKKSFQFCVSMLALYCALGAGLETGMVFVARHAAHNGNDIPVTLFGICSTILLGIGFLPQYWEIWHRKEVLGISYVFVIVDISGGVFNLLSLAFKKNLDIIAAADYSVVVVLDLVILIAAVILNPRARGRRAPKINQGGIPKVDPTPSTSTIRIGSESSQLEKELP